MRPAYHAQYGEDRAILKFFGETPGFYVDVGANDGVSNSNTAALDEMGWRGLLVEADPDLADLCRQARPSGTVIACAAGDPIRHGSQATFQRVSAGHDKTTGLSTLIDSLALHQKAIQIGASICTITVPLQSLDDILAKHGAPTAFELLSVDVEGAELEVFRSCDLARWRPRIIIAEDNSTGRDSRVRRYLRRFGYYLACRSGVNNWYVRLPDLPLFAGRRLRLALFQCGRAIERHTANLERLFGDQPSGFVVQLGFEISSDNGRIGVMDRDGWHGLLVEMDQDKVALARRTRNRFEVVCCAIAPESPHAASRAWLVPEFDWLGFSPHTRSIPQATIAPNGAVRSDLSARPLESVLRDYGVPENFDLLAIGSGFDAGDAVTSLDWQHFHPRLVLIDARGPGQERARRFLESAGWRRAHWCSMCFWYVRRADFVGFRRERLLLAMRSFLWALKSCLHRAFRTERESTNETTA
jgi:FkbM family methyltransferase